MVRSAAACGRGVRAGGARLSTSYAAPRRLNCAVATCGGLKRRMGAAPRVRADNRKQRANTAAGGARLPQRRRRVLVRVHSLRQRPVRPLQILLGRVPGDCARQKRRVSRRAKRSAAAHRRRARRERAARRTAEHGVQVRLRLGRRLRSLSFRFVHFGCAEAHAAAGAAARAALRRAARARERRARLWAHRALGGRCTGQTRRRGVPKNVRPASATDGTA